MTKTAFITGITGQDGAYLSRLLISKNYNVVGLTRGYGNVKSSNFKYLGIGDDIIMEECDLLDFSSIIKLLLKYK
ncbi:MAG: NAD-dependent epimerase/dehydratase family protein, partial [Sphingobacteriaceae bacterium]